MTKEEIRKEKLKKRSKLSAFEVLDKSNTIAEKIKKLDEFRKAKTILFYYPHNNEVDLRTLITQALEDKNVCLPYVEKESMTMTARSISNIDGLEVGRYGILSPKAESEIVKCENIDFIVVPLVAYDKNLNRIGYGGGYYDKYLKNCQKPFKCGVAFSCQRTDMIKKEKHDVLLDIIVTE